MSGEAWDKYFKNTEKLNASDVAVSAMKELQHCKGLVIDLGCGAGVDTLYFLENDWNVLAIDANPEFFIERSKKLPLSIQDNLTIQKQNFENLTLPKAECIIANFSLPFCKPGHFLLMWEKIISSLKKNAIFSGIFFGERDGWTQEYSDERTFLSKTQVEELFSTLSIISMEEKEFDGKCCGENGLPTPKHWHYFKVLAKN